MQPNYTAVPNCKNIMYCIKTREKRILITTSEQFTTAKWGLLMSRWIRAVEYGTCVTGLSDAHHCSQDQILLNYTRIENAHKVPKKTFDILLCIEVQKIFSCRFSLLKHSQMPECFYVNKCCFWARATVLSCYRNW